MHKFHLKVEYLLKKEINELYIMNALKTFALSTISIFLPIFLLTKGYSLFEVASYFVIHSIMGIIGCFFALKYVSKRGAKHSFILSLPFMILFFLILYNFNIFVSMFGFYELLIILGLLNAVSSSFYYMAFHVDFSKFSNNKKSIKELGIINILATIFSVLGPIFGSLIITFFSFNLLFAIVIIILIMSVVPLFFNLEIYEPFEFNLKKLLSVKHNAIPFFAEGIRDLPGRYFWPILLYIFAIKLSEIGGLYTISNSVLVVFTLFISHIATVKNKFKILRWGTIIHAITMIVRTVFKTLAVIAVIQGFGALSWTMVTLPFQSTFYDNSKKKGIIYSIYFREFYLHLGRIVIALFLMLLLYFISDVVLVLTITIIVGAIFTVIMSRIENE